MNEHEIIHHMRKNKNKDDYLPEYIKRYSGLYMEYSAIQEAFAIYSIYETLLQDLPSDMDLRWIDGPFRELFSALKDPDAPESTEGLLRLRDQFTEKMNTLTQYVDSFSIYEHILNRIEYRFKDVVLPDLDVAKDKMKKYIFSDKDPVITNDKIKSIVSELPVRMTKQRFFDIVSDSMSIYKKSDEQSLVGFGYMLRSNATIGSEFAPVEGLEGLAEFRQKCQETDYDLLDEKGYRALADEMKSYSEKIQFMVDLIMEMERCINHAYVQILLSPYCNLESQGLSDARELVKTLVSKSEHEGNTMSFSEFVVHTDEDRAFYGTSELLEKLEGKQEDVTERVMNFESVLGDLQDEYANHPGIPELVKCQKLVSSSLFMDLDEKPEESGDVSNEFLQKQTSELLEDFKTFFNENSPLVNRAVMSKILGTVPVFFNTAAEIEDYIDYAIHSCSDDAELMASLDIIDKIME